MRDVLYWNPQRLLCTTEKTLLFICHVWKNHLITKNYQKCVIETEFLIIYQYVFVAFKICAYNLAFFPVYINICQRRWNFFFENKQNHLGSIRVNSVMFRYICCVFCLKFDHNWVSLIWTVIILNNLRIILSNSGRIF